MNTQYFVGHGIRHVFGGYIERVHPVTKNGRFMLFFDVAVYSKEFAYGSPSVKRIAVMLRCENEEVLSQWATWLAENAMEACVECEEFYLTVGKGKFGPSPVFIVSRFTPMSGYDRPPEYVQTFLNAQEGLPANA